MLYTQLGLVVCDGVILCMFPSVCPTLSMVVVLSMVDLHRRVELYLAGGGLWQPRKLWLSAIYPQTYLMPLETAMSEYSFVMTFTIIL